jgi:hypothetical protein
MHQCIGGELANRRIGIAELGDLCIDRRRIGGSNFGCWNGCWLARNCWENRAQGGCRKESCYGKDRSHDAMVCAWVRELQELEAEQCFYS